MRPAHGVDERPCKVFVKIRHETVPVVAIVRKGGFFTQG